MPRHDDMSDGLHHPAGYFQSVDPGAVGTGRYWVDTTGAAPYPLKIRNAANTAWESVGSAGPSGPFVYSLIATSATVSNTITETAFDKSKLLNAGILNAAGTVVRVRASGDQAMASPGTITFKIRVGGTAFMTPLAVTVGDAGANQAWGAVGEFVVRTTGASGTLQPGYGGAGMLGSSGEFETWRPSVNMDDSVITKDLTGTLVIDVTVTMSVAHAANLADLRMLVIEILAPTGTF